MTPDARSVVLRRRPNLSALDIAGRLGLRGSLELCLDAGDAASYPSGASWLDRSGNGYDFFLGADGSATSTDPTFSGVAGGLSSAEYFSSDGGDYLVYDSANETWMENLHKDNAVFSYMAAFYLGSFGSNQALFGTSGGGDTTATGAVLQIVATTGSTRMRVVKASLGNFALDAVASNIPDLGKWNILGVTLDEAAGVGALFLNGIVTPFSAAYNAPSSGAASQVLQLGAGGGAVQPLANGGRQGLHMFWSRALQLGEIGAIYTSLRRRYGI